VTKSVTNCSCTTIWTIFGSW